MTLQRIAWLVTVAALLIGALVMLLSHYQGYAALFAAVAARPRSTCAERGRSLQPGGGV